MKKVLAIIFSILSCLCLFTGCNKGWYADQHKFLYEKMSEIPVEYDGYYFENIYGTEEAINKDTNEYIFRDKILLVEENKIIYDEKETIVDIDFMGERSQVFSYINHLWDEKLENNTQETYISGISVFDNKIFISTCGLKAQLAAEVKGETPFVLFYYDFDLDRIYYCGFYAGEIDEQGYYEGFLSNRPKSLVIRKKQEGSVLYYYDIDADMVYYCGFYSGELNENACYDGFRPDQQLMIVKDT